VFDPIKNILNETEFLLAKVFRRSNQPVRKEPEAEHRLNALIRVPEVRLVGDNLEDLSALLEEKIEVGVYKIAQVLAWAEKAELDLVEITPNAVPPVCRITDYQKFLYQKKKREKEIKANTTKTVIKEIRFTTETGEHDIEFKVRHAIEFLKEGSKVKGYVQFKGRGITFQDRGQLLLLKFIQALDDFGTPEGLPKMEGKRMFVFLTPKKKSK
jgi:translation initiation factor IF-3